MQMDCIYRIVLRSFGWDVVGGWVVVLVLVMVDGFLFAG